MGKIWLPCERYCFCARVLAWWTIFCPRSCLRYCRLRVLLPWRYRFLRDFVSSEILRTQRCLFYSTISLRYCFFELKLVGKGGLARHIVEATKSSMLGGETRWNGRLLLAVARLSQKNGCNIHNLGCEYPYSKWGSECLLRSCGSGSVQVGSSSQTRSQRNSTLHPVDDTLWMELGHKEDLIPNRQPVYFFLEAATGTFTFCSKIVG